MSCDNNFSFAAITALYTDILVHMQAYGHLCKVACAVTLRAHGEPMTAFEASQRLGLWEAFPVMKS